MPAQSMRRPFLPPGPGLESFHTPTALDMADRFTRLAVGRYHAARELSDEADAIALQHPNDRGASKFARLAHSALCDSAVSLLRFILARDPAVIDMKAQDAERRYHPGRGVSFAGKLYLALPDDNAELNPPSGSRHLMQLYVVELVNVESLDPLKGGAA